jgi:hypothetical protein
MLLSRYILSQLFRKFLLGLSFTKSDFLERRFQQPLLLSLAVERGAHRARAALDDAELRLRLRELRGRLLARDACVGVARGLAATSAAVREIASRSLAAFMLIR